MHEHEAHGRPHITLSMIVRNEEQRYLRQALETHRPWIDRAVIIDDGSTDGTVAMCRELLDGIPLVLVENPVSRFADEVSLRKQQWEETIATEPEWILNLDADEILTSDFGVVRDLLLSGHEDAIYFRLFDMWSETHYREDEFWQAHAYYRPFLIRYHPEMSCEWKETPQHCGRFPLTIQHLSYGCHAPRVKHYGWAREEDRIRKYDRYQALDPEARYGWKEQYASILDQEPRLLLWSEYGEGGMNTLRKDQLHKSNGETQETAELEDHQEPGRERILIASPVRQTAAVLREFLDSLHVLERTTVETDYLFVDDNEEEAASNMLREFVLQHEGTIVHADEHGGGSPDHKGVYAKDEGGHYWQDEQIWRVAGLKNYILKYARDNHYDAVFLIDSDLVLHPRTLEQLVSSGKDIVSNIFWTRWQPGTREMPQVWLQDEYALYRRGSKTSAGAEAEDEDTQTTAFLNQLRTPGCYEVGGLGACTLIRNNVLAAGVSYDQIPNVSFWGEDRHFCIRAQAFGFRLFVDTHYPAYHIYRLSELPGVAAFNRRARRGEETISITLCMIVKNEEASLARCLDSVNDIADEIVIVDTGSTDRTRQIAARYTECIFDFEWVDDFAAARNFAFDQATSEYILWLDADDVFEADDRVKFIELKRSLDPAVDSVTMDYHLSFTAEGRVAYSLRRNRLVRRDRNFRWIGAVHEYLAVAGNLFHSDVAVTHKKDKEYTDRNLRIYRKREQTGEDFSPRDLYYFGNELKDHGQHEDAVKYYEKFLDTGLGWVEDQIAACQKMADCEAALERSEQEVLALFRSFAYDLPRAEICCRLGGYFADREDYRKALFWYEQATRAVRPADPMVVLNEAAWTWMPHLQLCVCYDRMGNRVKAKEHNDIALTFHPTHPSMLYNDRYFKDLEKKNILENA